MMSAATTLPDDAYYREQNISVGSVHKLLAHCMAAHIVWLRRLNGIDPGDFAAERAARLTSEPT